MNTSSTPTPAGAVQERSGLTGLWQVSGKNRTTFEEMIRLDRQYAESRSLWLDLKIIAMTIPALCIQLADTLRGRRIRSAVQIPANGMATRSPQTVHDVAR